MDENQSINRINHLHRHPTRSVPVRSLNAPDAFSSSLVVAFSSSTAAAVSLSRVKETDRSIDRSPSLGRNYHRNRIDGSMDESIVRSSERRRRRSKTNKQTNKRTHERTSGFRGRSGATPCNAEPRTDGCGFGRLDGWMDLVRGVRTFGTYMISRFIRRFIYTV